MRRPQCDMRSLQMENARIRVLPAELADQIAAGEVVERPASVVKELCENALDAGARKIDITVEGGGLVSLVVSDDGFGMSPEDAHLALKRHATSKLTVFDDLHRLRTMGFRGEALPSIAAVSQLSLTTRTAQSDAAYRLEVEAGVAGESRETGAPVGTQVEVRRLLANVPARLKFVKGEATESAHINEAVLRLALAFPQIHFRLRSAGRTVFDLPPHASGLERARVALGRGSRSPVQLHLCAGEEHGVHVEGYLASPADAASTSRNTYPFVNRRFVRDRGLLQAIMMGYGELLERGRYPLAVLHVTVPGEGVDVNVHPQKLEVRFADAQAVYAAVRHAIASSVARAPWLREPAGSAVQVYSLPPMPRAASAREPSPSPRHVSEALRLFSPMSPMLPGLSRPVEPEPKPRPEGAVPEPGSFFSTLSYLGQLDLTYLVCEAPGELVLIDQHAAHERVAFQRLREAHATRKIRVQRLLIPATLDVDEPLAAACSEHSDLLRELGFEVSVSGNTLTVSALPESLGNASPAEVLGEVLADLHAREATAFVADRLDHLFATMACHSVVRAGDTLNEREVRALLESMDGVDYRAHCPHGRPVLLRLSISELERRFGRT
jgi:DNA mismatch repair protein MutL